MQRQRKSSAVSSEDSAAKKLAITRNLRYHNHAFTRNWRIVQRWGATRAPYEVSRESDAAVASLFCFSK